MVPKPMTKVLITGASGFIGRQVIASLAASDLEVMGVGRGAAPGGLAQSAQWRQLDLLEANGRELAALCADLEDGLLIHMAWETSHGHFWASRTNLSWLAASLKLCQAFIDAGGKRIVATGTCIEYDAPAEGRCMEATTPIAPKHLYGSTKEAFRRVLQSLQEAGKTDYAWARIFFPFGIFEKPERLVPSVIDALLDGRPAHCFSGSQIRDYIDVRDCGAAIAALARSAVCGEVNIGSGQPVRLADLIGRIATLIDGRDLGQLGALPNRTDEPGNLWADTKRLEEEVGFSPVRDLDTSLVDTIAWRRAVRGSQSQIRNGSSLAGGHLRES
jgi:nucleoside-diphosphate-sugar epimerase